MMGDPISLATNIGLVKGAEQVVGGLGDALSGSKAKERALDASKDATQRALGENDRSWERQQQELSPWKEAGQRALGRLQDGSFFEKDAGYQFRLNEGNNAINAALAARGMSNSGGALKQLTKYGQGFASNEYQNAWNRENQLANYGNNASMNLGQFAGQYGANASNYHLGLGNAQAAAQIGQANRSAQLVGAAMGAGAQAAGAYFGGGGGKMSGGAAGSAQQIGSLPNDYGHNHWLNSKSMWG